MSRPLGIIAYGDKDDRARLAMLAKADGRSGSDWLIRMIRERFKEVFGDLELPA